MFRPVENSVSFPTLEMGILDFWRENRIYEKSLDMRSEAEPFVFYEGPPTANGMPHPGHCITRAIKDLFPRYRTMRGFRCERKGGWDTHGLPVEVEVCKELGIHSKEQIEEYGVEPFIHKCVESVFRYIRQWEELTERLGFWIHLDEAYVTYHQSYVESVWWALKNLFDRGLLYQGHKIVWWWAQGGTALSSGEVGQGYREVADPSVYVRFPLVEPFDAELPDVDLIVWTTTPWTLPSNQFAAVRSDLEYALVEVSDEDENAEDRKVILASALVEPIAAKMKKKFRVLRTFLGEELLGRRYLPPYGGYYNAYGEMMGELKEGGTEVIAWRIVSADFVTTESGSGIVHQAPAFGEVDFDVLTQQQQRFVEGQGPELICCVAPDGTFYSEQHQGDPEHRWQFVPEEVRGMWVKEADKPLTRMLKDRGLLFHQEQYLHDYPFCWRAKDDPLIQYPRRSWFVRTTALKEQMLENNRRIGWTPEHIRDGRFGNFLESNVDWALSRERYWGTPLPIWVCEETGYTEAVGSYEELLMKPGIDGTEAWEKAKAAHPELADDLKIHKPYIDEVTYDSPKKPGARMRRVSEVIDCWFDAGSMPFAQWGYPHRTGSTERFSLQFPADFISEAIDQTRGWFYSLLAISTLLFGDESSPASEQPLVPKALEENPTPMVPFPHPFRNCIVLGLILGEDGQKMSKSLRNYREPKEIFDRYGADALRWYFYANQTPWTSIRYSEQAIKESMPEFLLRLWNVYGFFVIYANIDRFDPAGKVSYQAFKQDGGQLRPAAFESAERYRPIAERGELDRWILSELHQTIADVADFMDHYDNFNACGRLTAFVDALSNWYVRRSRERFWSSEDSQDKRDAYWTLYECLLTTVKLIAPFTPFIAEEIWRNLAVSVFTTGTRESVHLCDFPESDPSAIDVDLSQRMSLVREIVSLGRNARMGAKLKVRQPLARVEVVLADRTHHDWLLSQTELIRQELNVKEVEFIEQADKYIDYSVVPDFKRLGPRLGKKMPVVKKTLAGADGARLLSELEDRGKVTLDVDGETVELSPEDVQVRLQAKEGWTAAQGPGCVVVLSTEVTEELKIEGYARELVRLIQDRRKELDCRYTDRIAIGVKTSAESIRRALERHGDYIQAETLARNLQEDTLEGTEATEHHLDGEPVALSVAVVED